MLIGVAFGFALGLAEVALRIAGVGHPSFWAPDRFTGAMHRAGAEGWYRNEGEAYVRISSQGLRDREHVRPKPPGTFRIAFLGDSYTEAMQLDADATFWAVAERELASCPALAGRTVEAVNFGVSGYGTAQAFEALRHRAWDYEPDVVVLAFLTGNDLRNNVRELEGDPLRPYFVVRDGALVLDDSFLESPEWLRTQTWWWRLKDALISRLRVVQVINEARNALERNRRAPTVDQTEQPIYRPPADANWTAAWDVTERTIRSMRDEVVARNARFELLVLTNWRQVHPDVAVREREAAAQGAVDLRYPDRRLEAFGRAEGIETLALVDPLAEAAASRGVCLHGFPNANPCGGHWNAEGHRLGGEQLAKALCEQLGRDAEPSRAP